MRLEVVLPAAVLVDEEVARVAAESDYGTFTLLPNHIDFAAVLTPGLLSFTPVDGTQEHVALDGGTLVKVGARVLVATVHAVRDRDLGRLHRLIQEDFRSLSEHERRARMALARLESDFVRRYLEIHE